MKIPFPLTHSLAHSFSFFFIGFSLIKSQQNKKKKQLCKYQYLSMEQPRKKKEAKRSPPKKVKHKIKKKIISKTRV